eukprot:34183-Rhodomonas_salina.1
MLAQSKELLATLRLLDSNFSEAEKHWLAYTERRKEEFWSDWNSKHGVEAQKQRLERLWFIASNSRAGMVMRRKMRVLMKGLGRVGGDVDMDDDGMDEIELAEEEHRLALLALKTDEEEQHAAEEAKAKKSVRHPAFKLGSPPATAACAHVAWHRGWLCVAQRSTK